MVKERPEEARNSPKGNFYFFSSSLGELWRALALFHFLLFYSLFYSLFCSLFLLKFQNNV
ncbi:hypothetical protein [Helicobacter pylori]|uniref:hypothetical protein n=1 Tax=Helicobacter pylori TaxID=210 RepID=UPI000FDD7AE6|nr:hypothetical protein [Helicobacter pylori]RVY44524.1 hypothetical protein ECC27_04395 [Helicobacter pylori]